MVEAPRGDSAAEYCGGEGVVVDPLLAQFILKLAEAAGLPCGVARAADRPPCAVINLTSGQVVLPLGGEPEMRVRAWYASVEAQDRAGFEERVRAFVRRGWK